MNLNKNLDWELCEAYFSILEMSTTSEINLDKLCAEDKTSKKEVEKLVTSNPKDYRIFFLKTAFLLSF